MDELDRLVGSLEDEDVLARLRRPAGARRSGSSSPAGASDPDDAAIAFAVPDGASLLAEWCRSTIAGSNSGKRRERAAEDHRRAAHRRDADREVRRVEERDRAAPRRAASPAPTSQPVVPETTGTPVHEERARRVFGADSGARELERDVDDVGLERLEVVAPSRSRARTPCPRWTRTASIARPIFPWPDDESLHAASFSKNSRWSRRSASGASCLARRRSGSCPRRPAR